MCEITQIIPTMWTQRYAPQRLEQIVGHEIVRAQFQNYLRSGSLPHLLISGPNGSGKLSLVRCLLKEYLGEALQNPDMLLQVDGSIHRGKELVTGAKRGSGEPNILQFAKIRSPSKTLSKIVIIHDFNHLVVDTQMALRSLIEKYQDRIRFVLICTTQDDVIEAIQSRCVSCVLSAPTELEIRTVLERIVAEEHLEPVPEELWPHLQYAAHGSFRAGINALQVLYSAPKVSAESAEQIFDLQIIQDVIELIGCCVTKQSREALVRLQRIFNPGGYNVDDLLTVILYVLNHVEIAGVNGEQRSELIRILVKLSGGLNQDQSIIRLYQVVAQWAMLTV